MARRTLRAMAEGPAVTSDGPSAKPLGGMILDLKTDIRVFSELIESGESLTLQHGIQEEFKNNLIVSSILPKKR
ncbi:MAG: hypothetical protein ACR2HX_10195 [Pyrinomonadaceae bacterium]